MKSTQLAIATFLILGSSLQAETSCTPKLPRCPDPGNPSKESQPFEQGYELCPSQYPRAFNAPAAIDLDAQWDLFINASFIYWHADQDYMDVATNAVFNPTPNADGNFTAIAPTSSHVAYQDFRYKPGFKVGLGFNTNYDDWVASLDYTWLHETTHTHRNAPSDPAGTGVWIQNGWFTGIDADNTVMQASALTSNWKLHIDMLDLSMSRPFYQGTALTILPYGGLRTLWIKQTFNVNLFSQAAPSAAPWHSHNSSRSWALGPYGGFNTHWILGGGFRFEGTTGASILYTRYTKVRHSENDQGFPNATPFVGSIKSYGALRPILEAGMGFGWGSYFCSQSYHLDLSARYDFMIAWNQNMMRYLVGTLGHSGDVNPIGDLNLHGLTVNARFDF
jgi:hypothetical protein